MENQDSLLTDSSHIATIDEILRIDEDTQPTNTNAKEKVKDSKVNDNKISRNVENQQYQEVRKSKTLPDLMTGEEIQILPDLQKNHESTTLKEITKSPRRLPFLHIVVLIPSDYPETCFNKDIKTSLELSINKHFNFKNILERKFTIDSNHGALFIYCSDRMFKQSLIALIDRKPLLNGMQVKFYSPEDLILVSAVQFIIPKSEPFDKSLESINNLNENLEAKQWVLLVKTDLLKGYHVIYEIEEKSLLKLKEASMKILYKFQTISDIKILKTYYKQKGDTSRLISPSKIKSNDHNINSKSDVINFPNDSLHSLRKANQDSSLPGSSLMTSPQDDASPQSPDIQPLMVKETLKLPKVDGNRLFHKVENFQHQEVRKRMISIDLTSSDDGYLQNISHQSTSLREINKTPRLEAKHIVVVIPSDYPETCFNQDTKTRLELAIHQQIFNKNTQAPTPKFTDSEFKHNAVFIYCSDEISKQFLIDLINHKTLLPGIQLKSCNPEDLISVVTVEFIIPKGEPFDKSLEIINNSNKNLEAKQWILLGKTNLLKGYHVIYEIEEKSLLKLKEANMKILFKIQTISDIKILETYYKQNGDTSRLILPSKSNIRNFPYDSKQSLKFAAYNIGGLMCMKMTEVFQFLTEHDVFFIFYNISNKTFANVKMLYQAIKSNLEQYDLRLSSLKKNARSGPVWGYICGIHQMIQNNITFKYIYDFYYTLEVRNYNASNIYYMLPFNLNLNNWKEDFNKLKRIIKKGENLPFVLICDFNCKIGNSQAKIRKSGLADNESEYIRYTTSIKPKYYVLLKFLENNNLNVIEGQALNEFIRGLNNYLNKSVVNFCAISKDIHKNLTHIAPIKKYWSDHFPISVELAIKNR